MEYKINQINPENRSSTSLAIERIKLLEENENLKKEIHYLKGEIEELNYQIQDLNERRECLIEEKANNLDCRDLILLIKEVVENNLDISDIFFIYIKKYPIENKYMIENSLINFINFCLENNFEITIESVIKILNDKRFCINLNRVLPNFLNQLELNFKELEGIRDAYKYKECIHHNSVCYRCQKKSFCITNIEG